MNDNDKKHLTFTHKVKSNVRAITICDYVEDHFDDLISIAKSHYDFYAYVIHDKDENESGKHIHLLCMCKGGTSLPAHCRRFESVIPANFVCVVKSPRAMARYLIHKDNPEKYQYSFDEIVSNDLDKCASYISDIQDSKQVWSDFVKVKSGQLSVEDFLEIYRSEFYSMPFYQKVSLYNKFYDYFGGAHQRSSSSFPGR